ncbi:kinase-like domain-containing protein [Xylaria bambusicola]|uniref:kinase-like domain-containing protein n=1 Tax=Xylaria bambusicola TaxID=326684 RepID=UPI0020074382|nr:kinase-like domain-containing protein [Xylaria bambusicola]KAI0525941.1 kinase-like domain-containing protein [Xylaria bambusicola]
MDDSKIQRPTVTSLQDLELMEALDSKTHELKYVMFYHITSDGDLYYGQIYNKKMKDITLADYISALEHVSDEEVYPLVPEGITLKIAPDYWDDTTAFIKRPGLTCYKTMKGTEFIPQQILQETLIMEQLSKAPHPNIITYIGCQVKNGCRITAIVLERLDQTLAQLAQTPTFHQLDHDAVFKAIESAIHHIHSLGLAHNDINPHNIMFKNGKAVLIDFGSCQPFGKTLQSLGTPGWFEESFYTSEAKHDEYSLKKLKQWLQKPE